MTRLTKSEIYDYNGIISNTEFNQSKINFAKNVISELQKDALDYINKGFGPFVAAIYDDKGNLIAKCANSVVRDNCSNCHAEINTIKSAQQYLGNYDLSKYNLSIYVTSEPCIMCLGAILWSGIKSIYYGVKSCDVEAITGYDEGFKPNWFEEFSKRGISVCGNIESELGKGVLKKYIDDGNIVYKPSRD